MDEAHFDETDTEAERFFARGEAASEIDSLSPAAADESGGEEWEPPRWQSLTPEQLARRARLRRVVAIGLAVGVAVLVSSIGAARLLEATRARAHAAAAHAELVARMPNTHAHDVTPRSRAPVANPPPAPASTPDATASGLASAESPGSASTPSAPAGGEPSNAAAAARLATQARALLRAGRAREGLTSARAAVDADPTLAEAYVLVAAGLEDMGRWREAQHTYLTCVDHTRSAECRYFAGRPR